MTTKTLQNPPALFLPEFLGQNVLELGGSILFFDRIGFDIPTFLQPEVFEHFNKIGITIAKTKTPTETAFAIASKLFREAQENAKQTQEQLTPLFESRIFLGVLTVHFIMRSGHEWLKSQTRKVLPPLTSQLDNPAILYIAARGFIWYMHEVYLELDGDVQEIVKYVEEDAKNYKDPFQFLVSFIYHRMSALEDNPGPVLTNNPFWIHALASIGETTITGTNQVRSLIERECLAFTLFDSIVRPFAPKLDGKTPERLILLQTKRHIELNALRENARNIAVKLLEDSHNKIINEIDVNNYVISIQDNIRDVVELNRKTLKQYFQVLLEDKSIWIGVVGLIATLAGGLSPLVPASFGVTALATIGTEAMKAIRKRKEFLNTSQIRFLYYLDRSIRKK